MRLHIDIGARGDEPTTIETAAPILAGLAAKLKADPDRLQAGILRDVHGAEIGQYYYDPNLGGPNA